MRPRRFLLVALLLALACVLAWLQVQRNDDGVQPLTRGAELDARESVPARPGTPPSTPTVAEAGAGNRVVELPEVEDLQEHGARLQLEVVDRGDESVRDYMLSIDFVRPRRRLNVVPWQDVFTANGRSEHRFALREGWEEAVVDVRVTGEDFRVSMLELTVPELRADVVHRVVLSPAQSFSGTVVRANGTPISHAWVAVYRENGELYAESKADYRGAFDFEAEYAAEEDPSIVFSARARGFAPRWIDRAQAGGDWNELRVVLDPGARITGRVDPADGERRLELICRMAPSPGAATTLQSNWTSEVRVAEDGSFVMPLVPRARVMLRVIDRVGGAPRSPWRVIDLRQGSEAEARFDLSTLHGLEGSVTLEGLPDRTTVWVGVLDAASEPDSTWRGRNGESFVLPCAENAGAALTLRVYWGEQLYVDRTVTFADGDVTTVGELVISAVEQQTALAR